MAWGMGEESELMRVCVRCFSGLPLAPAAVKSRSGNPWVSVLYTWALVQVSLCICGIYYVQVNTGFIGALSPMSWCKVFPWGFSRMESFFFSQCK